MNALNAREDILAALRAARGTASTRTPEHIRPQLSNDGADLIDRFVERITARAATVTRLASLNDVGAAVLDFLGQHDLPARVVLAPALADLAWPELLDRHSGRAQPDDETSVTPCFAAVAESGSLVLLSGPRTPTTLNFVPANHIVIVETKQLLPHPEDVWTRLRSRPGGMPRAVNFIAGPSRTADVEQTIQLGAHGPRRLHVLLVGAAPQP